MQENSIVFDKVLARARTSIAKVNNSLSHLIQDLDDRFVEVAHALARTKGHILFTGVGKSACIAKKLSVTFASLGMPSFFLHPTDMGHGDLGNVTHNDIVFLISNSGETAELTTLMSAIQMRASQTIALVGNLNSTLATRSNLCLSTGQVDEICHLGLAPTTSTTVALVLGDSLAVCVAEIRQFKQDDFARSHPSGRLGQLLTLRVQDVMVPKEKCAQVDAQDSVLMSVLAMAEQSVNVSVVFQDQKAIGLQPVSLIHQAKMLNSDLTQMKNIQYVLPFDLYLETEVVLQEALSQVLSRKGRYFPVFVEGSFVGLFDADQWRP